MTLENSKRLYKHYKDNGRADLAADVAKNRPELKEAPKEVKKVSKK